MDSNDDDSGEAGDDGVVDAERAELGDDGERERRRGRAGNLNRGLWERRGRSVRRYGNGYYVQSGEFVRCDVAG
jgi:hypothetical protein